ncbi:MAG: hypothetical protein V7641_4674 [Blastocatellia bacterium]
MSVVIEAIYESGVFKPLSPVNEIKEHEKVRLVIESASLIDAQRDNRIQIDPQLAREIGDLETAMT